MFGTGMAVGMYVASQIKKRIDENVDENSYENKSKKMVRKIWSFTYVDIEGNKIDVPIQNHSFELTDKNYNEDDEIISECCGYKIMEGTDLCSKCKEHTGIDNN